MEAPISEEDFEVKALQFFIPTEGRTVLETANNKFNEQEEVHSTLCARAEEILRPYIAREIGRHRMVRRSDIEGRRFRSLRPFSHLWLHILAWHAQQIQNLPVEGQTETLDNIQLDIFVSHILMKKALRRWIYISSGQRVRLSNNWPPTAY